MSSDIGAHLPVLKRYASGRSVLELGVRNGCSTAAFLAGRPKRLVSVDQNDPGFNRNLPALAKAEGIAWEIVKGDSREPRGTFQVVFFDTLHTEAQIREELKVHEPETTEYLIFHDVIPCGVKGEDGGPGIIDPIVAVERSGKWQMDYLALNNNSLMILRRSHIPKISLTTDYPLAVTTEDHLKPCGTLNDDTHCLPFVRRCEQIYGRKIRFLDLGCAGGGLVLDFLQEGHFAVGLEGSDYSQRRNRAAWGKAPFHLFTCDITRPFICCDLEPFDVISAWAVLEHLSADGIRGTFRNVALHLKPGGLFCALVGLLPEHYHQTLQPAEWWTSFLRTIPGFRLVEDPYSRFSVPEMARGSGNGKFDADVSKRPEWGLHVVMERV